MSLLLFSYLGSEASALRKVGQTLYDEFKVEGVPKDFTSPLQDIIDEVDGLFQYLRDKSKFEPEITDLLDNFPSCTAQWLKLKNQLYTSSKTLIHQFSIRDNERIERAMIFLQSYQKGSFAEKEFSKAILISGLLASIERNWSHSRESASRLARRHLKSLLIYVTRLRETSQDEEANRLIERLRSLDLDIDLSSVN